MKTILPFLSFYSLAVLFGGLIGYVTAGSKPSLIAGLVFGLSLFACAYGMKKQNRMAAYTALILTFLLDGFFTQRFIKSLSFLPSGLMSLLSLVILIMLTLHLRNTHSSHKVQKKT